MYARNDNEINTNILNLIEFFLNRKTKNLYIKKEK